MTEAVRASTRAAVGMGIPMEIPMGMGMGWVWGLKFNPHGSPGKYMDGAYRVVLGVVDWL